MNPFGKPMQKIHLYTAVPHPLAGPLWMVSRFPPSMPIWSSCMLWNPSIALHSIALWFCTPCYLDPAERFPDFEMCASCAETFYFPSPVAVPSSWTCPGCQELAAGNLAAAQHCHRCGKIEKVIQRVDFQRDVSCPFCLGQGCSRCCPCPFCFGEGSSHC